MKTGIRWLNDYLEPDASKSEQAEMLTHAGFPLEEEGGEGDLQWQDFEMTSNRGDCLCHIGLARELAAYGRMSLRKPEITTLEGNGNASEHIQVSNREPKLCPRYTARVIKGITVGPSPPWLASRLESIGQIPRNCVVDATNFVLFEYGQPSHVFDLDTLKGGQIIIRKATEGEPFIPIGEGAESVKLRQNDLVIADQERAIAIAGVKGGAETAVTDGTTNILIEAATFDPVSVRRTSRELRISSDSSYRFERGVHPAAIDEAADRLTSLILELAGGQLIEGMVEDGAPIPAAPVVSMRTTRCRDLIGVDIPTEQMVDALERLELDPKVVGDAIECTIPSHRLDLTREVDLIEEVVRMWGLSNLPVNDMIPIRVNAENPMQTAVSRMKESLVAQGCFETISHTFIDLKHAQRFLDQKRDHARVDEDRPGNESALRPSLLPSLLEIRRRNLDSGVDQLKLFELASIHDREGTDHRERTMISILVDHDGEHQDVLRSTIGITERMLRSVAGFGCTIHLRDLEDQSDPWMHAAAAITVDDVPVGMVGLLDHDVLQGHGLEGPVGAAEIQVEALMRLYPPQIQAAPLPAYPSIQRDLSIQVPENTRWHQVRDLILQLQPDNLESIDFITTYRGKQVAGGMKSLTMRICFRSAERTLRNEEVDTAMERINAAMEDLTVTSGT